MDVFQETDYRKIIEQIFFQMPKHGHGQMSRLARHLKVNTTLVSQVLSKKRDFTEEQAFQTTQFFQFNKIESYYFVLLVQWARAASTEMKNFYLDQIKRQQIEAQQGLKNRVSVKKELSFEQQAVYYSSWLYAAIHTLVGIEGFDKIEAIAHRLRISTDQARLHIDQLINYNLLFERGSRYSVGAASTYLPPQSPLVIRHHQSWRQISNHRMEMQHNKDFFFTGPFSIHPSDYDLIRKELVELTGRLYKIVEKTKAQELACINIDLFKF
jgi:uncharacterized protein (TIGR02147 family)